jgi:mercuric ion transport protein
MPPARARSTAATILAALLAAVAASLCCLVPLILVLLGVGGAWLSTLTALEPWRPMFSIVAIGALVATAWTLYAPTARCREDRLCIAPVVLARRRLLFWLAATLVIFLLLSPYLLAWFL